MSNANDNVFFINKGKRLKIAKVPFAGVDYVTDILEQWLSGNGANILQMHRMASPEVHNDVLMVKEALEALARDTDVLMLDGD